MHKYIFIIVTAFILVSCTSADEDEKIRLFWQEQLASLVPGFGSLPTPSVPTLPTPPQPETAQTPPAKAVAFKPIEAMLFVSPSCPRCQQLKRDRWVARFREKYDGTIHLTEYDLSIAKNDRLLEQMMRRYHLSRVAYPTLFIEGHVVQGYPLNAEPVVQKILAQYPAPSQPTILQIALEDTPSSNQKASRQDIQSMQQDLAQIRQANQKTIQDIGQMFGMQVQNQALAICSQTEQEIQNLAQISPTFQQYLAARKKTVQEQDRKINTLLQQNTHLLRHIRG